MPFKWCAVPLCGNSMFKTPEKVFINIPNDEKIREKWLILARRKPSTLQHKLVVFFCEDHFDVQNDIENYTQHKLGFCKQVILKHDVFPSKFECQNKPNQQRRSKLLIDYNMLHLGGNINGAGALKINVNSEDLTQENEFQTKNLKTYYKSCAVAFCNSKSINNSSKVFVYVPRTPEIRAKWLQLGGRDPNLISSKSSLYFCEDHFDLPNDMDNYVQFRIMGSVKAVKMKPDCLPSKFECLKHRIKPTSISSGSRFFPNQNEDIIVSKPLDGQDICLTCLQQNSAMVSINQVFTDHKTVTIADVLNELNCLNIADVENATKQICIDCFNKLKFCYNFQQQCRKSESIWKGSTTYNENADTNSSNEWTVSLVDPAKATQSVNVSIVKTEMKTEPEDGCTESVMEFEEIQIKEEPLVCNNEEPSNLSPANIKEAAIDESIIPQHLQTKTNCEDNVHLLCLLCKLSFDKRTNFWSHTKTVHIDDCALQMIPTCETINDFKFCYITSYCRKCNLHFISEDIFLSHLKTHPESSENVCSLCKAVFDDSQKYYLHVKRHFVPLEKYLHLPPS